MAVQFLLTGLLLSMPASARSVDGIALSGEELSRRQGLLVSFQTHFDPQLGEATGRIHDQERGTCLTGLVRELKESWHLFDADERREMTAKLAPMKADLLDPLLPAAPVGVAPAGLMPPGSCWGEQKDHTILTDHFSVQWDEGIISLSQAEAFAESLEYSYEIEVDELGWREPEGLPDYQILVLVEGGGGAGAYTTVESCGGRYLPYVVAYAGSFSASGSWYKTMACHELHHAIQFGYGYAHEFWYWEASATWVEDHVYPDLNDWSNAVYVYSLVPYMGMNASGRSDDYLFMHTYAMGIWGMFLDQHIGGNDLVKDTWDVARMSSCQYCLWMPDAIDRTGEDFTELYAQFIGTNAVMDYQDRLWLRTPTLTDDVDSLPASGESSYQDRPQSLGQNFIRFDSALGSSGQALEVSFEGMDDPDSWVAVLVRGDIAVEEIVVFEIGEDHRGTAQIDFPGGTSVHLVVSPMDEEAQGYYYDWTRADDFDYEWTAQLVSAAVDPEGEGEGGGDDVDPGAEFDNGGSGEVIGKESTSCACSAGGSADLGWLALVLGLVPVVRRRR